VRIYLLNYFGSDLQRAEVVESLAESSESVCDPFVFDAFRSFLKYADALTGSTMSKLLDSLLSGLTAQTEAARTDIDGGDNAAIAAHRAPLERYAFLLNWFVSAAEKVKGADGDEPAPAKPRRGRGGRAGAAAGRKAAARAAGWSWEEQIPGTLERIVRVLRLKTQRIWTTTTERDTFIKYAALLR
jgi:condensin complex subunit 1